MAIRVGSGGGGGLKYQVPNYGQISASRAQTSASAGGSAVASAYGTNRRAATAKLQMQNQAEQDFYNREHDAGSQLAAQESRERMQARDLVAGGARQLSSQNHQMAMQNQRLDYNQQQQQAEEAQQLQALKYADSYGGFAGMPAAGPGVLVIGTMGAALGGQQPTPASPDSGYARPRTLEEAQGSLSDGDLFTAPDGTLRRWKAQ